MNGLSLLVALTTLGVISVEWEPTPSGRPIYTIRVEPLVVDQLGEGSAIESVVDKRDRATVRNFRVVVGPKSQQSQRIAASTANEVDYGWRPNVNGGIDYYVQISRERLELLARGTPLECEVLADVPEIETIYVFVGDEKLPRELPPGLRSSTAPRDRNTYGGVAPASGTETGPAAPRYGNAGNAPTGNAPIGSSQTNVSDVNHNGGYGPSSTQGNYSNTATNAPPTYGPDPYAGTRNPASPPPGRYDQIGNNMLPVPPLDSNRPPAYGYGNQYAQQQQPYAPPAAQTAALPGQQQYNSQQGQLQPYGTQPPTYPIGAATPPGADALAASLAFTQSQLEKAQLEKAQLEKDRLALASAPPASAKLPPAEPKSSKPLILTTLALFASIGANAYLGWLAWSFFWRFRDAASDLSRARSNAFPAGSLAGH